MTADSSQHPVVKPVRYRRVARWFDAEILFGVLSKFASAIYGLGSVILVGHFLSPMQQGFFFSLMSFATLSMLVDLGLNTALIQFTSHECARADAATTDEERDEARSRLVSIGRFAMRWFCCASVAFFVVGGIGGELFFVSLPGGEEVVWGPWPLLAAAIACDVALLPAWSLLEGAGYVREVYSYRTGRMIFLALGTWTVLALGGGLWALAFGYIAVFPLSISMALRHRTFFGQYFAPSVRGRVSWLNEMMPLQWRLAGSWLAGYLTFWSTTPICMKLLDPVSAGRIGMALSLAMGIGSVGDALVMVKFRQFGTLVVLRRWRELDRLALRQGLAAAALTLMGSVCVFLSAAILDALGDPFAQRLPTLPTLATIFVANLLLHATVPMVAYLRAHKREPFLWPSVALTVVMVSTIIILGALDGEFGVAMAYLITSALYVPGAVVLFTYCRRAWHRAMRHDG